MKISTTKTEASLNKTAHSPKEQRFNRAWQRVVKQQKENDCFREDLHTFTRETLDRIQDSEKMCMEAMYDTCLHLLGFFSRKSLTQWQRETLLAWVAEDLHTMQNSHFGAHLDMEPIRQRINEAVKTIYPGLSLQPEYPAGNPGFHNDSTPGSMHGDSFIEHGHPDFSAEFEQTGRASYTNRKQDDDDASQAFFQYFFEQQKAFEQERQEQSQALKQLMKSSSVNKLFRKVAGILHPDKETNDAARQEKNRLMGELIKARNTNDIPRIFTFYAKYVGHSPLQELGEDLDSVTHLLERQYQDLRHIKESVLNEEPLTASLSRKSHGKTPAATQRAINNHLREIAAQTHNLRAMRQEITSLRMLKPYLEFHYKFLIQAEKQDYI